MYYKIIYKLLNVRFKRTLNVLQISEGGLMRLDCFARFCLCAVISRFF